jgi:DNA-binding protein H-NS
MEEQAVEKVLEASNNDLDSAIKSLNLLRLSTSRQAASDQHASDPFSGRPDEFGVQQAEASSQTQSEGSKWVELLISQMMNASDLESARGRAMHTLEAFEKTVISRSAAVIDDIQKENVALKEQNRGLMHDNQILKRAVAIQHERQQDHEGRALELQQVKQLLSQYQEQVRTLELNNYSLTLHLRQAQEGSSMPGRFHPDVF